MFRLFWLKAVSLFNSFYCYHLGGWEELYSSQICYFRMGNLGSVPLEKLLELGEEPRIPIMSGVKAAIVGVVGGAVFIFTLIGALMFEQYLERPAKVRECIKSVEPQHLPTDLCENKCFRNNYLEFRNDYLRIQQECKNLGLSQTDKIDYLGLAYKRAIDICKNE